MSLKPLTVLVTLTLNIVSNWAYLCNCGKQFFFSSACEEDCSFGVCQPKRDTCGFVNLLMLHKCGTEAGLAQMCDQDQDGAGCPVETCHRNNTAVVVR